MTTRAGKEDQYPHLMFVNSRIVATETLSAETFFSWYDDDHIPDVLDTGKVARAARYVQTVKNATRPFLALYDIDSPYLYTTSEFAAVRVTSAELPGTGAIFDLANFDIRFYSRVQLFEPPGTKKGPAPFIMVVAMDTQPGVTDEDLDAWYRTEHLEMLAKCSGFRRSRRYRLEYATENRKDPKESEVPVPPGWLSLHEWETELVSGPELDAANSTERAKTILSNVTWSVEMYSLRKEFPGKNNF